MRALPLSILVLLLGAGPARADREAALSIEGFSRDSRHVWFREGDTLVHLDREGRRAPAPPAAGQRLQRGTMLKGGPARMAGGGLGLRLDAAAQRVHLTKGSRSVPVWTGEDPACKASALVEGRLSPDRRTLAAVLQRDCGPLPLVVSLGHVVQSLVAQAQTLARQGQHVPAASALESAHAFDPRSALVIYRRAAFAALRGDERVAVSWLEKLRVLGTPEARRLLVRVRFDADFRLVQDSSALKTLLAPR